MADGELLKADKIPRRSSGGFSLGDAAKEIPRRFLVSKRLMNHYYI